jgi:hypothetical protein
VDDARARQLVAIMDDMIAEHGKARDYNRALVGHC